MTAVDKFSDMLANEAADTSTGIEDAITSRRSVRGFLPDEVPVDLLRHILNVSARAPSGTNMQPWEGYVLTGAKLDEVREKTLAVHFSEDAKNHGKEYKYYPDKFFEPFLGRRRKVGFDMYNIVGIKKGDTERMHEQAGRNFAFFDAPAAMVFSINKGLEIGSWLDYGMFLQNIMLVARAYGLHTCPQAAWPTYHKVVRPIIGMPEDQTLVCAIAIGYEDKSLPINDLTTERVDADDFMTWLTD